MLCGLNQELDDTWNPLWFPAFGDQSGEFVELQPERGLPAGPLWSFHSHDGTVYTSFDSVAALFRTTLELWRVGMLPLTGVPIPASLRELIASHNHVARHPDGSYRLRRSTHPSFDWPDAWLIAAGLGLPSPADDADVITIAELLADPWYERPVRGEFRCAMGSAGWWTGTLTDETGSVNVHLDRASTENYRLLLTSNRVEMILTPITEGDTVDEALAACNFESDLEESVTRRFVEAAAASYHATRVVPLPG